MKNDFGGSTITQQLIKNTVLSAEPELQAQNSGSLPGHAAGNPVHQGSRSWKATWNTIYLGENYYGVQVAAQGYFGKSLGDLTLRGAPC